MEDDFFIAGMSMLIFIIVVSSSGFLYKFYIKKKNKQKLQNIPFCKMTAEEYQFIHGLIKEIKTHPKQKLDEMDRLAKIYMGIIIIMFFIIVLIFFLLLGKFNSF